MEIKTRLLVVAVVLMGASSSAQSPAASLSTWQKTPDVRRATPADEALAQLAVSADGGELTIRGAAPDSLRVCVEPARGKFGPRRCFTVGDVRDGRLEVRR